MLDDLTPLLTELADEDRPARSIDLTRLSDLARAQLAQFRLAWETYRAERRRELVSSMVERAELNIQLNFHAVLRVCLTDDDAGVRRLAIEGLWEDEKASLIQPLAFILSNDTDAEVRAAAAISLGRFVLLGELDEISSDLAQTADQALREAWFRQGEVNEVRRRALEGLAYSGAAGISELIENAYYDEDALMRQSSVFAMGRSNNPRWSHIVLAELGSYESAMRFEAVQAAGELTLKAAIPALLRRLEDSDGSVREAAATALGKIGGPVAKRALESVVGGSDEPLAQAAEEALEEWNFSSDNIDNLLMDVEERALKEQAELDNGFDDDELGIDSLDAEEIVTEGDEFDADFDELDDEFDFDFEAGDDEGEEDDEDFDDDGFAAFGGNGFANKRGDGFGSKGTDGFGAEGTEYDDEDRS